MVCAGVLLGAVEGSKTRYKISSTLCVRTLQSVDGGNPKTTCLMTTPHMSEGPCGHHL